MTTSPLSKARAVFATLVIVWSVAWFRPLLTANAMPAPAPLTTQPPSPSPTPIPTDLTLTAQTVTVTATTSTPDATLTARVTSSVTVTPTSPTNTVTPTFVPTVVTATVSATPTFILTVATVTVSATSSGVPSTVTSSATFIPTVVTATVSATSTFPTPTATTTSNATVTFVPTVVTATVSATSTFPTPTATATFFPSPVTETATPRVTITVTQPTLTVTPSATITTTPPTVTVTATTVVTQTVMPSPSVTPATITATSTGTATATGTTTATATRTTTATSTSTGTATTTVTSTATRTATATSTRTRTPTATTSNINLVADKLEVNQAVQDLNNSVRLVKNKRTFVRFHVHSATNATYLTYALLKVQRGGNTVWLAPLNGFINVRPAPNRATLNDSFLFELPNGYKEGNVTLTGYLNPETNWRARNPVETTYADNDLQTAVAFEAVPPVNVVAYRLGYTVGGKTYYPGGWEVDQMASWIRSAYPLSTLNLWKRSAYWGQGAAAQGTLVTPNCTQVNNYLFIKKVWDLVTFQGIPLGARYYGMVADGGGFMRGCASNIPGWVSSGPTGPGTFGWDFDGSYGDWYGAHELAHDWSRGHANFCGAVGGPAYPYPNGRISPALNGNQALYGLDIRSLAIYPPTWRDVMTYCQNLWVSDFTYHGLMTYYQAGVVGPNRSAVVADRLLVVGTIDIASGAVTLEPLFVVPAAADVKPATSGAYAIVLRDNTGAELARYPFTAYLADDDSNTLMINEFVPYIAGTSSVEIEGPAGLLKAVQPGSATPTVNLLTPLGGEILNSTTVTVTWAGIDTDGEALVYHLQYSRDNGQSWEMVAQNLTGNLLALDASNLGNTTQGLFRIWASDGLHTTSDTTSAPFTVPNHVPTAQIVKPASAVTIAMSETLMLQAEAYDIDTGSLSDQQLQWASDLDGVLGNGAELSVAALTPGAHTITLRADDGEGGVVTATVSVTVVGDESQVPPPASEPVAGMSAITFDPLSGANSVTLSIDNANSAQPITWNATADATWVQLSATTGTTPDQITVSLNGAGLSVGRHTATITLSSPDTPGKIAEIVVVVDIPGLYLPLVIK